MNNKKTLRCLAVALLVGLAAVWYASAAEQPAEKAAASTEKPDVKWAPAVDPKPLSEQVHRGVKWLVEHQLNSGAWGQGEESAHMGRGAKLRLVLRDRSSGGVLRSRRWPTCRWSSWHHRGTLKFTSSKSTSPRGVVRTASMTLMTV